MIEAKVRQDVEDETPTIFAEWNVSIELRGDFDIREYCMDLDVTELPEFLTMVEGGEVTLDVLEVLSDDISETFWHHLPKNLTFKINDVELRKYIEHRIEQLTKEN